MTYRVVQWTTGNVGRRSVRAIVANPLLELVGCYAYGSDKVGRDAGELAGIDPTGVLRDRRHRRPARAAPGLRLATTRSGPTSTISAGSSNRASTS